MIFDKFINTILEAQQEEYEDTVYDAYAKRHLSRDEYLKHWNPAGDEGINKNINYMFDVDIVLGSLEDDLAQPQGAMMPDKVLQRAVILVKNVYDKYVDNFKGQSESLEYILNYYADDILATINRVSKNNPGSVASSMESTYGLKLGTKSRDEIKQTLGNLLINKNKQLASQQPPAVARAVDTTNLDKYLKQLSTGRETTQVGMDWMAGRGVEWYVDSIKSLPPQTKELYLNKLAQSLETASEGTLGGTLKRTYSSPEGIKANLKKRYQI